MRTGTKRLVCAVAAGTSFTAGFAAEKLQTFNEMCNYYELGTLPAPSYDAQAASETNICSTEFPDCDSTTALATFYGGANMRPVTLDQVDDDVERLFLSTEQREFYYTNEIDGIDTVKRIAGRGLISSIEARSIQLPSGASDPVMMLIRNYAPEAMPTNDACRKLFEITAGQKLLDTYAGPKDENGRYPNKAYLLQELFNVAYLGRGARGVALASEALLGKQIGDLTLIEAAIIAGLFQSPDGFDGSDEDPSKNEAQLDALVKRTEAVLLNYIEDAKDPDMPYGTDEERQALEDLRKAEVEQARAAQPDIKALIVPYNEISQGPQTDYRRADELGIRHFINEVESIVKSELELTDAEFRDGLNINTPLSIEVSERMRDAINSTDWPRDGRQMAGVVLAQGAIRAMHGGDYAASQVNLATAPGPVGSSLKPHVFAHADKVGAITGLDQVFVEEDPFKWPGVNIGGTEWQVDEGSHCANPLACDGYEALRKSSNKIPLQIARDMGQAGLDGIIEDMRAFYMQSQSGANPSLVTGWWETDITSLASGMDGLVANQGVSHKPRYVDSVTRDTPNGPEFADNGKFIPPEPQRVHSAETATQITEALRGTVREGTAASALSHLPFDAAGKTGSAPEDAAAVFTGTAATRLGNLTASFVMRNVGSNAPMSGNTVGGGYPAQAFGRLMEPLGDPNGRIG